MAGQEAKLEQLTGELTELRAADANAGHMLSTQTPQTARP